MNTQYSPAEIQAWVAQKYPNRELYLQPYGYNTTFAGLDAGTTQQAQVQIAANADFVLLGVNHRAQIGAAQTVSTKTAPFVRLLVTDSGSNEQFTNSAVDLENYSANDGKIQNLPYPRIISGRSALTLQVTNYAPTDEDYETLDIFFSGVLVRVLRSI